MQKIIFLDIDGVLSPQHYMNCLHKMWKASFSEIKSQDDFGINENILKIIANKLG